MLINFNGLMKKPRNPIVYPPAPVAARHRRPPRFYPPAAQAEILSASRLNPSPDRYTSLMTFWG